MNRNTWLDCSIKTCCQWGDSHLYLYLEPDRRVLTCNLNRVAVTDSPISLMQQTNFGWKECQVLYLAPASYL